jgi:uncharacterized protein YegP (UPF0339 family)
MSANNQEQVTEKGAGKETFVSSMRFSYEHSIEFRSIGDDEFRVKVDAAASGIVFWLESKKSKQQWQKTVTSFKELSPSAAGSMPIPEEAVAAMLKVNYTARSECAYCNC